MINTLTQGGTVAIIGALTVFVVLIILWGLLELMKSRFAPKSQEVPKTEIQPNVELSKAEIKTDVLEDDSELIAVLTAAIAASLNTSTYHLHIKSYRQVNNNSPAWNQMSRRENLLSRL